MTLPMAPDWLKKRGGKINPGLRDYIAVAIIGDRPEFRLELRPAGGKFCCVVSHTNNGKTLPAGEPQPTPDAAWSDGFDRLRRQLGW